MINDLKSLNISEIANKYGRTKSTIYYWLNNYEIRQKTERPTVNKLIICVELNLTFKTLRDAAEIVYKSSSDNVAYFISQAAKLGKSYKGYHWEFLDKQ